MIQIDSVQNTFKYLNHDESRNLVQTHIMMFFFRILLVKYAISMVLSLFIPFSLINSKAPNFLVKNANTIVIPKEPVVDLVYTWVNGSDRTWYKKFIQDAQNKLIRLYGNDFENRFVDLDELKYSLRSVEKHMKWINKIYIVTANQVPSWLNTSHPKISIISHNDIFPQEMRNDMPSYNSYAIEFSLCNIPGLSEHYIYMNDDMFIGKPIEKDFFFDSDGKPKIPSKQKDWGNVNSMVKSLHHHSQRNDMKGVQFSCVVHNTVQICQNYFKKTQKGEYDHTPTPITKKIMKEIYKNFPDTIHSTITSQFRNYTNVLMQLLVQLYGVGSGLATPLPVTANISKFFMVSGVSAFSGLKEDKPILFCVNTDISHFRNDVKHTLDEWMPDKSEYEL